MRSRNKPSKKAQSRFLVTGSILVILIGFSPYIFYLYEIFPEGPIWENSLFTYESRYYENVLTAAWTYLGKITPLFLLFIWFFTCKHWWYHVILVPIGMYVFQLLTAIYDDLYWGQEPAIDTNQLIYLAPFFIIILSFVYLIRIKIFDRIYGIDLGELEQENLNPFSALSDKDHEEVKSFRDDMVSAQTEEDYYVKL